jgi:predicted transcriptional regulator
METDELSETEATIVVVLREGRARTEYMAAEIEYSRSHLNTMLQILLAKGVIRNVHAPTALYESVNKSMKTATDNNDESATDD